MRAFNFVCASCGEEGDRIVKGNEIVKCSKCESIMEKVGGPIGGSDILPVSIGEANKFVSFESVTLGRDIKTESEMQKAYEEMYGIKSVVSKPPAEVPAVPAKKAGRPGRPAKKVEVEDDDDDEKDED